MKQRFLVAVLAAALIAVPASAGYRLMPAGKSFTVGKSLLTVTPTVDWNRLGARPGRNAESWTLDGLSLNDVTFYGGIPNDTTLFREISKKEKPLPRFSSTMLAPDIAQLFEGSYRIANGTALMTIESIAPATFANKPGFRFTYSMVREGEEVKRQGEANGAVIDGKLYMITFEAPAIHYFDASVDAYRKLASSAVLAAASKS